jgi:uncharacterized coiled-coil protein SlyX
MDEIVVPDDQVVRDLNEVIRTQEGELIEHSDRIADQELAIEGLSQANTDLGQKLEGLAEAAKQAAEALKDLSEVPLADLVDSIAVIRHQLEYALKTDG